MSNSRFEGFFPNDTLVQVGSVILNTITGKVVAFAEIDTVYSESSAKPELISHFTSPDPLADKYPEWSPYVYTLDNPIRYTDPTGMAVEETATGTTYTGADAQNAFAQLQRQEHHRNAMQEVRQLSGEPGDDPIKGNKKEKPDEKLASWEQRKSAANKNYGDSPAKSWEFWVDALTGEGGFEPSPYQVKSEMPELITWFTPGGGLPAIKGLQKGLRNPGVAKAIMKAMQEGTFNYTELRGIIGGFVDAKGAYYISDGHHRIAAAMEIFRTTGDVKPLVQLIANGRWSTVTSTPAAARPLPALDTWGKVRNWIGF